MLGNGYWNQKTLPSSSQFYERRCLHRYVSIPLLFHPSGSCEKRHYDVLRKASAVIDGDPLTYWYADTVGMRHGVDCSPVRRN